MRTRYNQLPGLNRRRRVTAGAGLMTSTHNSANTGPLAVGPLAEELFSTLQGNVVSWPNVVSISPGRKLINHVDEPPT